MIHVYLGMHSKMGDYLMAQITDKKEITVHPKYDSIYGWHDNNIAIIMLPSAVKITDRVGPICLPAMKDEMYKDEEAIAIGWGLDDNLNMSSVLKVVALLYFLQYQ